MRDISRICFKNQFDFRQVVEEQVNVKLCRYINEHFRPKYKSNRDFALSCGIDEKNVRQIQQEKYNPSINLLKRICESQNVKISKVLNAIGE